MSGMAGVMRVAVEQNQQARAIARTMKGKRVRIVSTWRDQPYGTSKPDLKGQVREIRDVVLEDGRVWLWLEGCDYTIDARKVDLLAGGDDGRE